MYKTQENPHVRPIACINAIESFEGSKRDTNVIRLGLECLLPSSAYNQVALTYRIVLVRSLQSPNSCALASALPSPAHNTTELQSQLLPLPPTTLTIF